MDDSADTRDDLKLPEGDMGKEIEKRITADESFFVSFVLSPTPTFCMSFWKEMTQNAGRWHCLMLREHEPKYEELLFFSFSPEVTVLKAMGEETVVGVKAQVI